VILALAAAGCAGTTGLAGSPEADRRVARRALADAAAAGPVPLVVAGDPGPLAAADLPALAARGVRGLDPRFEPASEPARAGAPRLVLWFDPPPVPAGRRRAVPTPSGRPRRGCRACSRRGARVRRPRPR
jgi:hypothetical protein